MTTPNPTPTLTGRDLGIAERATRAVLERLLAETDTPFEHWIALNLVATNDDTIDRDDLVAQMTAGLRIDAQAVATTLDELQAAHLVTVTPGAVARVETTAAGRARYEQIQGQIDGIATRLYGGLPVDDLATAHRVLAIVTERANAELAAPR